MIEKLAEARAIPSEGWTFESFIALHEKIGYGDTVLGNEDRTQEEFDRALSWLIEAINGLVPEEVVHYDYSELEAKILEAEAMEPDKDLYTPTTYGSLMDYLTKSKQLVEFKNAKGQWEVDSYTRWLEDRINQLFLSSEFSDYYANIYGDEELTYIVDAFTANIRIGGDVNVNDRLGQYYTEYPDMIYQGDESDLIYTSTEGETKEFKFYANDPEWFDEDILWNKINEAYEVWGPGGWEQDGLDFLKDEIEYAEGVRDNPEATKRMHTLAINRLERAIEALVSL